MGPVTQNKIMGKVKSSPFKSLPSTGGTSTKTSNLPLYGGLVLAGVAAILFLRAGKSQTGPLVVLTQSAAPDQSTIDNLTASINAWGEQLKGPPGGASTPQTPAPNTSGA